MRHEIAWALLWIATTACSGNAATAGGQGGNDSGGVANPASGGGSGQSGATSSGGSSGSGGRSSTGGGAHSGGSGATAPLDSGPGGEPRDASDGATPGDGSDDSADGGVCAGWDSILTRIDKACETDSNCALVSHEIGCCGEQELVGVNAEEAPA